MDKPEGPDLRGAAASLEEAKTQIQKAVCQILRPPNSEHLWDISLKLGLIAAQFRDSDNRPAGLKITLVDRKEGARAMGSSQSPKKLAALAKARNVLAEKRRLEAERRMIYRRVARRKVV